MSGSSGRDAGLFHFQDLIRRQPETGKRRQEQDKQEGRDRLCKGFHGIPLFFPCSYMNPPFWKWPQACLTPGAVSDIK
jgi:hypothetical protein